MDATAPGAGVPVSTGGPAGAELTPRGGAARPWGACDPPEASTAAVATATPTPGGTASWQDYGKLAVEEGAHVYGVDTSLPESEPGVHLYGIGRDGSTVTVVMWGQMGHLADAPVPAFGKTTTTAVNRLDP